MQQIQDMNEARKVLRTFIPNAKQVDWFFALEHMKELMHDLGDPQDRLKIIHVAGTSGKTSTCYYLARMLQLSGKIVGLTVSPHVDSVTERVQINGLPLSETEFCNLLETFVNLPAVQKAHPTYFGLLVAFAYWIFAQKQVDYAVIEVGMGGRLDATNVATQPEKVCAITDIGLDHTHFLGNNITSIATEKAGIIHNGNSVFVIEQSTAAMSVISSVTQKNQAKLNIVTTNDIEQVSKNLPLLQRRNWAVAQEVYKYICSRDSIGLVPLATSTQLVIPARLEAFSYQDKTIITDGAHNGQKITALCESLKERYVKKFACLVGFVEDKDTTLQDSLRALFTISDSLIITEFTAGQDVPKKPMPAEHIAAAAKSMGFTNIQIHKHPQSAFDLLLQSPEDLLLVTGSFYLLNHIRPLVFKNATQK